MAWGPAPRFEGNPLWRAPTPETSEWAKKPEYDPEAAQRKFDEYELDHPAVTRTGFFGGNEKKFDSRGREVKDPSKRKRLWDYLGGESWSL